MASFLRELKHRKVYRVAIAYIITGWLVVQIASTVLPAFDVPRWVLSAFVILLALALPVVLVLSWAFNLTLGGLERERAQSATAEIRNSRYRVWLISAGVAAAILVLLIYGYSEGWWNNSAGGSGEVRPPVIAVMPFASLSADKENSYFADGIQDEIITQLTKIAALKVISRRSTQQYQGKVPSAPEVAKQLGVSYVLQGTVQRAGNDVRVNVQLVNAATDSHVWAESFDRKMTDMFGVESEVAEKIAKSLNARLSGKEQDALAFKPTTNPLAYDAFLRGLAYERRPAVAPDTYENAVRFYDQAVAADPNFAVAWAHLAVMHSSMYHFGFDHTPARLAAMQRAAETASRLQYDLGETHLAWGFYQYRGARDYDAAAAAFRRAHERLPNNAQVLQAISFVTRRQGKWQEVLSLMEKVAELDPRNAQVHAEWAYTLIYVRQFERARQIADRAFSIAPNDPALSALSATIYQADGNLPAARQALAAVPLDAGNTTVFNAQMTQLLFERQFEPAINGLTAALREPDRSLGDQIGEYRVLLALAQRAGRDEAASRATCARGIEQLEEMRKRGVETWYLAACLGLLRAGIGDEAGAMREADQALVLTGPDVSSKPEIEEARARMFAQLGRAPAAVSALERLLSAWYQKSFYGSTITPALLRIDPAWDPIRGDPKFEKLVQAGR